MMKKLLPLFIVLVFAISACTEDGNLNNDRVRCYLSAQTDGNKPSVDFIYNKRNIAKIIEYGTDGKVKQQLIPGFDGEGKISIIRYLDVANKAFAFLNYEYSENRLIKKTSYYTYGPVEDTLKYYQTFFYNSINQMTKEYFYDIKNKIPVLRFYITYTYNSGGNIIFSSKYLWVQVTAKDWAPELESSGEYEYDFQRNKALEMPFLWGYSTYSANNIVKARFRDKYGSDLPASYYSTYNYNPEGYPTKEVRTFMFGGESQMFDYKYNCYNPTDTVPST